MARTTALLSGLLAAALAAASAAAQTLHYELVHAFDVVGQPRAPLIQATDGSFYGTTLAGGPRGVGTIFQVDASGTLTTLHSFHGADGAKPRAGAIQASDGNFYGTTSSGGANGHGTVFRLDSSGALTTLHSFSGADGSAPTAGLLQAADGNFYGTTSAGGNNACPLSEGCGTVFRIDSSGALTTLHSFTDVDGNSPNAALIQADDGNFYGTTTVGGTELCEFPPFPPSRCRGTIFRMEPSGVVASLYTFGTGTGSRPSAALVQADDGIFYGTTLFGGTNFRGTVFNMQPPAVVTTLHSFDGTDGNRPEAALIQAADGSFYGTTSRGGGTHCADPAFDCGGTAFRMEASGGVTTLHSFLRTDGSEPVAALVQAADGNFYGTTSAGGLDDAGTVFRLSTAGALTTLHSFVNAAGASPQVALVQAGDGALYGTTTGSGDGVHGFGAIFRIGSPGKATALHRFQEADGPIHTALIQAADGSFYGSTTGGRASGLLIPGSIFKMDSSGQLITLHTFGGINDASSALVQAEDGDFYGTNRFGGAGVFDGTVFKMDSTGTLTTLHSFDGTDGSGPRAALLQAADGDFYGTTWLGGGNGIGTIFQMDSLGTLTTLHSFGNAAGDDGYEPTAALIQATDGNLYGTTSSGGPTGAGTVFTLDPSGTYMTLYAFGGGDSALLGAPDENFYGTTPFGVLEGTVFRVDSSGNYGTVHDFTGPGGSRPLAELILAADGNFYGTASAGGPSGGGVVFRLTTANFSANAITPTSGRASGGSALVVLGGGFLTGASLTIGGAAAGSVTVPDPTFLDASTPVLSPGTLNDVSVTNPGNAPAGGSASLVGAYFADFLDVPQSDLFHSHVETIFRSGITAGCGSGNYCRNAAVTRAQMAVFLLKAEHGAAHMPPACTDLFPDVPCPGPFADWIEELAAEGITGGCGGGNYCPNDPVTRAHMAVFLLKTEHGSAYEPPDCTGVFADVACSPTPAFAVNWIEQLAAEGITGGCGGGNYCPAAANTRGQMAVFLVKTFGLVLPP